MNVVSKIALLALTAISMFQPVALAGGEDYDFTQACLNQLQDLTKATLGATNNIKIHSKAGKPTTGISPMDGKTH